MSLIQLKPREQAFYQMAKDLTRKFGAIILCEGRKDAEILKALIAKTEISLRGNIGVTDCGGMPAIQDVAAFTATLARLSRRLAIIAIIVDADEHTFNQRAQSVINSLRANRIDIRETHKVAESLYNAKTKKLDVLVQIAGIKGLPFQKHTIEDHVIQLLLLERKMKKQEIKEAKEAKEIITKQKMNPKTIIQNSEEQKVEQAFRSIIKLLKALKTSLV
jgi:hypothetical protein